MKILIIGIICILCFAILSSPFDITDTPRPSHTYSMGKIDVLRYDLEFDVPDFADASPVESLICLETIKFMNLAPGDTEFALDFEGLSVLYAYLWRPSTGDYLLIRHSFEDSLLWLYYGPSGFPDTVEIFLYLFIKTGTGIYKENSSDGNIFYTLFWPSLARRAFACVDHPADRASCDLKVNVFTDDESLIVAAGGNQVYGYYDDSTGSYRCEFLYNEPVCTYNISFATGRYATIDTNAIGGSVAVRSFAYPSRLTQTSYDFGRIPQILALFDSLFGDYPFTVAGCVITPMAVWGGTGGMEHQTLPNIGDRLITGMRTYEAVVAHELSHQWFGDCVGIADWRDFWLNEGIAVYSEVLWKEWTSGATAARTYMNNIERDYRNYATITADFPIYDPADYLSPIPYNKGACWWHMLRWMLGNDSFFDFLRFYYNRYKYRTVITDSLKNCLEEWTSLDWTAYFDEWIFQQGFPEYLYDFHTHTVGSEYKLDVNLRQIQSLPMCTLFTNPIPIKIVTIDTTIEEVISPTSRNFWTTFWLTDSVSDVIFDPLNIICGTFAWSPSGIAENLPQNINLHIEAYPNPFNSSISFDLRGAAANQQDSRVRIAKWEIFDIDGRLIYSNPHGSACDPKESHAAAPRKWTPIKTLPSGVYFLKAKFEGKTYSKKITFIK